MEETLSATQSSKLSVRNVMIALVVFALTLGLLLDPSGQVTRSVVAYTGLGLLVAGWVIGTSDQPMRGASIVVLGALFIVVAFARPGLFAAAEAGRTITSVEAHQHR